jgi:hypothetical protein
MKSLTLVTVIVFTLASLASAGVVDFESTATGNAILSGPTAVQGLTFTSAHYHIPDSVVGTYGGSVEPVNYLALDAPGLGFPVTVTQTGGGVFSVLSLDASQLWGDSGAAAAGGYANADFLHLLGNINGGGTVTADLQLGFGFTNFALTGFTNLDSMVISGYVVGGTDNASWAVDNIEFSSVPEPGSWAALMLGLGGLSYAIARRKRA